MGFFEELYSQEEMTPNRMGDFTDLVKLEGEVNREAYKPQEISSDPVAVSQFQLEESPTVESSATPVVTQRFGNKSSIERFSGGVNYGTDYGVKEGTKIKVPQGNWKVVEAYAKARTGGANNPNRGENRGYGNSVLLENKETGERLRFSHLKPDGVMVQPGQELRGGQIFAQSGQTGNVTGPHLDFEYYNSQGKIADVDKTPYSTQVWGSGGGNPMDSLATRINNSRINDDYTMGDVLSGNKDASEAMNKQMMEWTMGVSGSISPKSITKPLAYRLAALNKPDVRNVMGGFVQAVESKNPQLIEKVGRDAQSLAMALYDEGFKINPYATNKTLAKEFNQFIEFADNFKQFLRK
jgi:murein DD-endopeptidase MepM/ murein hydrolase activator NlpD